MTLLELSTIDTKIAIVYRDDEWKNKIYNAILEECNIYDTIERRKDKIFIKNLKIDICFYKYYDSSRGFRIDNLFVQDGIPEEYINTIFKPKFLRMKDVIKIDYDEKCKKFITLGN